MILESIFQVHPEDSGYNGPDTHDETPDLNEETHLYYLISDTVKVSAE